ncbi:hypothetical protein FGIG_02691 [Fasciola gigantica]|uniref:Uncharacterized protein n=1 Tax=Fasciola gigantica TaxID=46835 RepID=A0A504YK66_FASGI|nr:hypothetical protein FGIG_02691 [Fasciola gigantica]
MRDSSSAVCMCFILQSPEMKTYERSVFLILILASERPVLCAESNSRSHRSCGFRNLSNSGAAAVYRVKLPMELGDRF